MSHEVLAALQQTVHLVTNRCWIYFPITLNKNWGCFFNNVIRSLLSPVEDTSSAGLLPARAGEDPGHPHDGHRPLLHV